MRGVVFIENKVGYKNTTKCGSTSIKQGFYQFLTGKNNLLERPHVYFKPNIKKIDNLPFRFTVVRDPIKRFLSAYNNIVLQNFHMQNDKTLDKIKRRYPELNIKNPTIQEFIKDFKKYYQISVIYRHFIPFKEMLVDLDFFTYVYKLEDMKKLEKDLSDFLKKPIAFPKVNTTRVDEKQPTLKEL